MHLCDIGCLGGKQLAIIGSQIKTGCCVGSSCKNIDKQSDYQSNRWAEAEYLSRRRRTFVSEALSMYIVWLQTWMLLQ